MPPVVSVGDQAPDFDLTSTEDVLLMLRDEVPRTAVVLYFFAGPQSASAQRDLVFLARQKRSLAAKRAVVRGISPAKLDELKQMQRELKLPFPLLRDDRSLASAYGFGTESEEAEPKPVLVVVNRRQTIIWMAAPVESVEAAFPEIQRALGDLPSQAAGYPRKVVNRLVDLWVNRFRKPRAA